jgi:hypothetical protein
MKTTCAFFQWNLQFSCRVPTDVDFLGQAGSSEPMESQMQSSP